MRVHRRLAWLPLSAVAVGLSLAGCSSDDSGEGAGSPSTTAESSPTASGPPTAPVADPVATVQTCLDGGDLATDPEEEPRFDALAELQVVVSGAESDVGVFVYATPQDASAHEQQLEDAGASSTEVLGTVVLTGTVDPSAEAAAAVDAVRACAAATLE